jgi:hypothetical protein
MIQRKQRKENNIWIKQKQKYSTKKAKLRSPMRFSNNPMWFLKIPM